MGEEYLKVVPARLDKTPRLVLGPDERSLALLVGTLAPELHNTAPRAKDSPRYL